jgi:hypothetical protein
MPTYTIQGKKVTTEQPLSDTEIEEIARDLGASKTDSIFGLEEFINPAIAQIPTEGYPTAPPAQPQSSAGNRMLQNALSGAMAVPPLAAGARALQLATMGSRAAPYAANLARAVIPTSGRALLTEGAIGGAGGLVGGEAGQQTAQKFGEPFRPLGEFAGGMLGGMTADTLVRNVPDVVMGGFRAASGLPAANQVSDLLGSIRAQTKLQTALEANPSLAGDLTRASEITALTGIKLPVTAAAKGDPTLTGLLTSETARSENSLFTAVIAQQQKLAKDGVIQAQKELASSPNRVEALATLKAAKDNLENVNRESIFAQQQAARQDKINAIDDRITEISTGSLAAPSGKEDIGTRLTNLLDAKKTIIKEELKPEYTKLLGQAKTDGVVIDSTQVASLWNFVKTSRAEDVFAKFPDLYSKVQSTLAPKTAPVSAKFAEKYPNLVKTPDGTYKPMDVDTIDSLKRAINKSIGNTSDADNLRMLYAFKSKFDDALGSIQGDFPTAYKALDKTYAERLGIPFSENGVLAVDKARFVESVVPNLTTKPSAIKQILAATDNSVETLKLVEDAFMMKLSNSPGILNPSTMEIDVPRLNLFLKQNKEAIDTVPGLMDRLSRAGGSVERLKTTRTSLLEEQKTASIDKLNTVWQRSQNTSGGFEGFVNSALKKPEQLQELILLASTDKTLQRGLKSSILDIGLNSTNKVEFFTDNSKTIDTLFGKGHSEKIKALFEASERLAKFPVSSKINPSLFQRTPFEGATGSRIEQVAGEIRNPILSTFRTFGNILSRYVQNKATKSESAEIQEFLSNPKAIADASALINELESKTLTLTKKGLDLLKSVSKNKASSALFGGIAAAGTGEAGLTERQPIQQFGQTEE